MKFRNMFKQNKRRGQKTMCVVAAIGALATAYVLMVPAITITDDAATPEAGFFDEGDQAQAPEPDVATDPAPANETPEPEPAEEPSDSAGEPIDGGASENEATEPEGAEIGANSEAEAEATSPDDSADAEADATDAEADAAEASDDPELLHKKVDLGDGTFMDVRVEDPDDVLPEGTRLEVGGIDQAKLESTLDLMKAKAEEEEGIDPALCGVIAADLKLVDADGNVVKPSGKIRVKVACPAIERDVQFAIVHVKYAEPDEDHNGINDVDEGKEEPKDKANIVPLKEVDLDGHTVQFEVKDFKPYAIGPYAIVYIPPAEEDEQGEGADDAEGEEEAGLITTEDETPDEAVEDEGGPVELTPENAHAQSFEGAFEAADGTLVNVAVDADECTFPDGTTMHVEAVEEQEVLDAALGEAADGTGMAPEDMSVLAADITFLDAEGNEIEPAKPVHVAMVAQDASEFSQAAIVHVDDGQVATLVEDAEPHANLGAVYFDADAFSVYAMVYTVDFHWEVDGKVYEFSIPGGGYVSLRALVEVLGVANADGQDDVVADSEGGQGADPNSAVEGVGQEADGLADETAVDDRVGETVRAEESDQEAGRAEEVLTLSGIPISDETREFVADVESVEFSSPDLLWVGKNDDDTTVGELKEANGLECQYNAELTEDQIVEINAQTAEDGDWALISLKPFDTEEYLTVTLKTGEIFTIKVTDAQENPLGLDGKTFSIAAHKGNADYYLGNEVSSSNANCLKAYSYNPSDGGTPTGAAWTFEWTGEGKKYLIHDQNNRYIVIEDDKVRLADRETALSNPITVISKEGKYSFLNNNNQGLNIYGSSGFGRWPYDATNSDFLMTLQDPSNLKKPGTIATADTSGVLQINLYNYGPENEIDKEANNNSNPYSGGINSGHALKFFSYGKSVNNGINGFSGDSSVRPGIVADQLGADNYPYLDTANSEVSTSESLSYLFSSGDYVEPHEGVNHLFTLDENGYYHYDSNDNYAYLDGSNFKVYSKTFPEEGADEKYFGVGFFPFNDYNEYYNCIHGKNGFEYWGPHNGGTNKAGHYDHHFGMSLTGNFIMPPGGQYNGNDITYEFSGDDDMWVFIDGVLILDIGGIHNPAHGMINFTDGTVTVNGVEQTNLRDKYKQVTGEDWDDSDFSNHDFRVFYMERGGMYSNLEVTFNLPLTAATETGDFSFDKVSSENESLKLPDAEFTLFTDLTCEEQFTLANVPVKATSDRDGVVSFKNIPHGTYYMKETVYPQGYEAKSPEEVFTVVVGASGTTITSSGGSVTTVTNQPKKIVVDVKKNWENGNPPADASVGIVLGRYKLVEDPNAQGTGTLVIRDSYSGLPDDSNYRVTYTITGPDNYSKTITKSITGTSNTIEETVLDVPAGVQYTVTKSVNAIAYNNITNANQTVTSPVVPKKGSAEAVLSQSTISRNAYGVTVYYLDKNNNVNLWLNTDYYPANSSLYLEGYYADDGWKRGKRFKYSFDNNTYTDFQIINQGQYNQTGRTETFVLNHDVNIYIKINENNSDWNNEYDWFKPVEIKGANPVRAAGTNRLMMAPTKLMTSTQTASNPTLPTPPNDTIYVLDEEYAEEPGVITLTGGTWTGQATGLDAWNEYGPYVYYIAEVNETGMPSGTTVSIADDVTFDGSTKVLNVTNTLPDKGELKLKKSLAGISLNDFTAAQKDAITFTITGPDNYSRTVKLSELDANLEMTISDLEPGNYTVVETRPDSSTPDGYRWVSTTYSVDGGATTVVAGGVAEVTVTNTYEKYIDVTLQKVDKDHVSEADPPLLKGAAFTISKYPEKGASGKDATWGDQGSKTLIDEKQGEDTYSLNGTFVFEGLTEGYYVIEEIAWPAGYVTLDSNPSFFVEEDSSGNLVIVLDDDVNGLVKLANGQMTINVGNEPGTPLPHTGGPGTKVFTILGLVLIAGTGLLLWRKRRIV